MIPMIDLLMVTVSFLLITAVWTHMSRIDGTTRVPGPPDPSSKPPEQLTRMHVDVPPGDGAFVLTVRRGPAVVDTTSVSRAETASLGAKLDELRRAHAGDLASEESRIVVLHTDDKLRYGDMVSVMDAISSIKDPRGKHGESAFHVNLATK